MTVKVIAECGVNYNSLADAFESIDAAKVAGCDAAKFQLYDARVIKGSPYFERLSKIMLDLEGARSLVEHGSEVGLPVFFSCMHRDAIKWVAKLKVPYIKIRELDWRQYRRSGNGELIADSLETGLPLLISSQPDDLPGEREKRERYAGVRWLLCCPQYPAPLDWFKESYFVMYHGISNHYPGFGPILMGVCKGMTIVEAHFTQSHTRGDIDDNVSFDAKQMAQLVRTIRELERLGSSAPTTRTRGG